MKETLDIQYKRGAHHNYLVMECLEKNDYQFTMLTENKIPGLLSAELRMNNGEEQLYYEISSLQPLARLYEHKGMKRDDYISFVRGLVHSFEGMQEYLLSEERVLLDPKYIFISPGEGEVQLLFYPYTEQEEGFLRLTEFLMDHAEHDDGEAVKIAYDFYKIVRQENFVIGDLKRLLERKEESREEKIWENTESKEEFSSEYENDVKEDWNKEVTQSEPEIEESEPAEEKKSKGIFKSLKKKEGKKPGGLSKLSGWLLKPKEEEEAEKEEETYENIYAEKIFTPKNMGITEPVESRKESHKEPPKEEYGKTTFFESLDDDEERLLVQTNKGKEHQFALTDFPKTVGKMEGSVDFCIRDGSISRMHARFVEKNGRVYIEDCNSTNGTFVNGMRLNEEESVLIESGDEIRFGKVCFEYH
ncbi:MAG: FHA domain-containing protein [Lachnospiraceae bacterium]|nr:FHA domain-containing protein [Lachnospiraceae bacterium]